MAREHHRRVSLRTRPVLRSFRHRNYRLFFGGQLVSLVGTWMQSVAQGWLVLTLTNSPLDLGIVAAVQFVPVLVLGLFGGVIADAFPKKRTLLVAQTVMMILAFVLAGLTLTGVVEVWMIVVLALLLGCANAVDMPVRQAFVIEMVGREDVANAVALNSAMFNTARIVGPAIAGLTIAAIGIGPAFVVNGLSFVAVIAALLAMRDAELRPVTLGPVPHSVREVADSLADGLRYVRRTPVVLLAVVVVGVVSTAGMNFTVVLPAYARDVLGQGAAGYGLLMSSLGVGSVVAALALAARGRATPWAIVGGAVLAGLAEIAMAPTRVYGVALLLGFAVGLGAVSMAANANSTIQLAVPDRLRGRVIGVYTTVFVGSTPIGGLATGAIASALGVAAAVAIGGAISAAAGVAGAVWLRSIRERERERARAIAGAGGA
jgi:MFS family permease